MSYEIINSDCIKAMQEMTDGCIDAIVTDPPYGLSFMGANWDHNVPSVAYWSECLRVAKSGAHLLCFGGTRMFHRLMCAIEDAGWEIRDTIMWVYGCLDEETEILVDGEFVPYNKAKIGSLALGYDIERGTFSWQRIEDTYLYDYDDTAYAIQSDFTDQLVSRNHRCIVERGGVEQFAFAEQVAQEREACVPVLEGLQGLLDHLSLPHEGAGDEEQDVLEGVRGEGGESRAEEAQGARAKHDMPSMRERVLRADGVEAQGSDKLLLGKLQEQGQVRADVGCVQQGTPDANVGGTEAAAQRNDGWGTEPVVEGRRHVSAQPRELQGCEVRQMPQGVLGDGTQGRVRDGAQACGCPSNREAADKAGMRASRQSRPVGQQTREPDAVPVERGSQALRELWGAKSTLARVTPVHYKGKMWCVKVRTGAFVARRHGKIFITGNSGFPKSMDVGKAIDKALGAKREQVRIPASEVRNPKVINSGHGIDGGDRPWMKKALEVGYHEKDSDVPVTDQAKEWDGWGTCLKPAWEPIIVARKPLDGTVAHNVMTYGTGAINIDGCRVPTGDNLNGGAYAANGTHRDDGWRYQRGGAGEYRQPAGRFPANLVHDGSQEVLELFPDSKGQQARVAGNEPSRTGDNGIYGHYGQRNEFVPRGDSGSAARFFNTFRDGEDSAERTYTDRGGTNFAAKPGMRREPTSADRFFYCAKASKKDRGEGNDHPTVKPNALMRWLVRLVCPQGGIVLDPFMGSGSTGVACMQEGMEFVGIDKDKHYCDVADQRMRRELDGGIQRSMF